MSKKRNHTLVGLPNSVELPENPWLTKFEYLVRSHLMKAQLVAEKDVISNENPYRTYITEVEAYIASINQSRMWFTMLHRNKMIDEWLTLRRAESQNVLSFITQMTSEYLFLLTHDGFTTLCRELSIAFSYTKNDGSITVEDDPILSKYLTKQSEMFTLFKENPWIVTLTLLNMMNPL